MSAYAGQEYLQTKTEALLAFAERDLGLEKNEAARQEARDVSIRRSQISAEQFRLAQEAFRIADAEMRRFGGSSEYYRMIRNLNMSSIAASAMRREIADLLAEAATPRIDPNIIGIGAELASASGGALDGIASTTEDAEDPDDDDSDDNFD